MNLAAQTADLQRSVEQGIGTLDRLENTTKRIGGVMAAVFSAQQVMQWGQQMVQAFSEQENASAKLTAALTAQGQSTPAVIDQYNALAATFQKTTVFGDELVLEMQALLVQVGNVMPGQMDAALRAATDLASGLGIDLKTATQLVGKAFAGETGTLKRYGIVIDEAALKTRGADAVLEAISDRFGGQAQAAAGTFTGKMAILSNQIGDFKEVVGETLVNVLLPLMNFFTNLPAPVQNVAVGVGVLVTALAPLGVAAGGIALAFGTTIPAAFAAVLPFLGPAGLIVAGIAAVLLVWKNWDAIAGVVQRVYEAVKTWLVDRFAAIVDSVKAKIDAVTGFFGNMYDKVVGNSYVPDMVTEIGMHMDRLEGEMVAPAQAATGKVVGVFAGVKASLSSAFTDLPNVIMAAITGGGNVGGAIGGSIFGKLFDAGGPLVGGITKTLSGTLGKTIGGAMGSMIPGIGTLLGGMAGELIGPLISKVSGFFKTLFGGVSQAERQGRDAAASFRVELEGMLTSTQRVEAGNERWKQSVIVVRDAYIAAGRTEQEALAIMDALWKAEVQGGGAVAAVIREIQGVMQSGVTPALQDLGTVGSQVFTGLIGDATAFNVVASAPIQKTIKVAWDISNFPGLPSPSSPSGAGPNDPGFRGATQGDIDAFLRNNPGDEHRIRTAFSNVTDPNLRSKYGFAAGTQGQFLDFGAGTPVTLHGRERVVTEAEGRTEASRVAGLEQELRALRRELPRAIGIALQDALVLAR